MGYITETSSKEYYYIVARRRNADWLSDNHFWDEDNWTYIGSCDEHDDAVKFCSEHQRMRGMNHSYIVQKKVVSYFADSPRHLYSYWNEADNNEA